MKRTLIIAMLLAMWAIYGSAQAGTLVWDFDGPTTTTGLAAGVIDADALGHWGMADPQYYTAIVGVMDSLETTTGSFYMNYSAVTGGAVAAANPFTLAMQYGYYPGLNDSASLNMVEANTNYPYLIIKGTIGWPTDSKLGAFVLLNGFQQVIKYANATDGTEITPNVDARMVYNLNEISDSQCYDQTANAMAGALVNPLKGDYTTIVDVAFSFIGTSAPTTMPPLWTNEFDPDPAKTYVKLDWVAFTDDPDFNNELEVPVDLNAARNWTVME